ncbi:MAG: hypothetical protein ABH821_04310 [archaeon]
MKTHKGQIMSLDFVLSVVIIALVIGVIVQWQELNAYNLKDAEINNELKRIALNASELAVSSPAIVCEMQGAGGTSLRYLNNCIDLEKIDLITKKDLGIPEDFECLIKTENGSETFTACDDTETKVENKFSFKREIVSITGVLSKEEFENCADKEIITNCNLVEDNLIIEVWKEIT